MNIKETEIKTGLSRANIRFYEKEGLLSPRRLPNGYRDYTEENIQTLLRVKLLRQLGVSVSQLSSLQKQETNLCELLEQKIREMEQEREQLALSEKVCSAMIAERVQYERLDAVRYLKLSEEFARQSRSIPGDPQEVLRKDILTQEPHPWRRFFARLIDMQLYSLLLLAVYYILLGQCPGKGALFEAIILILATLLMLALEPLMISRLSTTPGKWIFAIRVRNADGGRLSYRQALERSKGVLRLGLGYYLPVYHWVRLYKSYKIYALEGKELDWDDPAEYSYRDFSRWKMAGAAFAAALIFMAGAALHDYALLPRYRGEITLEEFAHNYNRYSGYFGWNEGEYMDADGEMKSEGVVIYFSPKPVYAFRSSDGALEEVSFRIETDKEVILGFQEETLLAALSFIGAQEEISFWNGGIRNVIKEISRFSLEDFDFHLAGVRLYCQIDSSGYTKIDDYYLSQENTPHSFRLLFVMRKE